MKVLLVVSVVVLLHQHSGFSKSLSSESELQNKISIATLLGAIDIRPSICVNIVVFPNNTFSKFTSATFEILTIEDLHKYPVVLVGTSDDEAVGVDVTLTRLKETNRIHPTEGCRVLMDFSNQHFGHVSPTDNKKQALRVFTYEIEFHYRAEPNLTSFIRHYAHSMDTTIRPYAKTLLVGMRNASAFQLVYCISCESRCTPITTDKDKISSPYDITMHCMLKTHGQNLFAYVQADASVRHRIRKPQSNCEYITSLVIKHKLRCTYGEVMVRLIAMRLNLSFVVDNSVFKKLPLIKDFSYEDELEDVDANPGLVMCVEWCYMTEDVYMEGRAVGSILFDDKAYAMYCNEVHISQNPSWLEIFDFCDVFTWIGIIGSALAAGVISWNLRYSLDVFFILFGQQPQCDWRRSGKDLLLGTFILSMMILNQDYISTLTNQVTAPLQKYRILSLRELFSSGYKFPAPNAHALAYFNSLIENRYNKLNMGNQTLYDHAVITKKMDISGGIEPHWFRVMTKYKYIIPGSWREYKMLHTGNLFTQNRLANYSCYVVKDDEEEDDQHLFKRDFWYIFRGRMKDKAYRLIQRLHHAAVYNFWRAEDRRAAFRKSEVKLTCWNNPEICSDDTLFQPLKWNSRFKIVFYWHLAFCAAAYISFIVEKLLYSEKQRSEGSETNYCGLGMCNGRNTFPRRDNKSTGILVEGTSKIQILNYQ